MTNPELYLRNGNRASLKDVCNWWVKTYPADVFVGKPKNVVRIRKCAEKILDMIDGGQE